MTPAQYRRVKELFIAASGMPFAEREAWLDQRCEDDPEVRAEVAEMLAAEAGPGFATQDQLDGGGARLIAECAASIDAQPTQTPARIGPYRILHKLGQGGMGVVYAAEQESPRRDVALKVLPPGPNSSQMLQRFRREVDLLGRLRHSGIAQVYEAGVAEIRTDAGITIEQPFFAMELVQGLPLDEYAREHDLDRAARLELFARVCDAVHHAHSRDVIHRDLKPANIFVEPGGHPKVLDFGVSRATDADKHTLTLQTNEGQLLGTVPYMSPEQVAGDPSRVDARSDVYSLGVVLFELLAERLPHDLRNQPIPEAVRIIRDEEPTRLGTIDTSFRGDIETIVGKAMEKDPTRRYRSAVELAADIRRHLHNQPIVARPQSTFYRVRKFARRHRVLVGGISATILSLAIGLAGMTQLALREATARRTSERASYRASLSAAAAALRENDIATAERHLAAAPVALRGWEWRHLHSRLDGSLASVALDDYGRPPGASELTRGVAQVWFSESGAALHLERVRRYNGRTVYVETYDPQSLERRAHWSVDRVSLFAPLASGEACVCQGSNGTTLIYDTSSGLERARTEPLAPNNDLAFMATSVPPSADIARCLNSINDRRTIAGPLAISRDGRWVAFMRRLGGGEAPQVSVCGPAEPERVLSLGDAPEGVSDIVFSPDGRYLATAGNNRRLAVFDLESDGRLVWQRTDAHMDAILAVAFSPDGRVLASGGQDKVLRFWDALDGAARGAFIGHREPIFEVQFQPDGRRVFTSSALTLKTWPPPGGTSPGMVSSQEWFVNAVAVSPDGSLLAEGTRDIHLRDAASGRLIASIEPADTHGAVFGLSFKDARSLAAVVGPRQSARLVVYDMLTGRVTAQLDDPQRAVESCFGDDGRLLSPAEGARVNLRDPAASSYVAGVLGRIALSAPQAGRIAVFFDRTLAVYGLDAQRPLPLWRRETSANRPSRMVLFANGTRLAIAFDNSVSIIDADSGREIAVLRGHTQGVTCIAALPKSNRLVTGSEDRTIRLWDLDAMEEVAELRGHLDTVLDLAVPPDESAIFSGAGDYTVRRWGTRPASDLYAAQSAYDKIAARLQPEIDALLESGCEPEAAAESLGRTETLSPRERQIARQLILRRMCDQSDGG